MIYEEIQYKRSGKSGRSKYELTRDILCQTGIEGHYINNHYCILYLTGKFIIKKGFYWNGTTMFPDFADDMHAVLIHDALYSLIGDGYLGYDCQEEADKALLAQLDRDSANPVRAWVMFTAVRLFGSFFL